MPRQEGQGHVSAGIIFHIFLFMIYTILATELNRDSTSVQCVSTRQKPLSALYSLWRTARLSKQEREV